ncbi:hypothetical protein ILYODFUR_037881 [Ilyodon furcidens]|uniref:Uncharacterized protein n=1 Tax=Ilyodon furcidens TaxID=33524 RepID=A0ABV0UMT0_9TELE
MITLFEYFRRAAEKSARQSSFWGTKLARPLPGTGPLRYHTSPPFHRWPPPPEATTSQRRSSEPEFGAARFLCPVRDSSLPLLHSPCADPAKTRRRHASAPFPEGCADTSSSLPEGWTTASRLSPASRRSSRLLAYSLVRCSGPQLRHPKPKVHSAFQRPFAAPLWLPVEAQVILSFCPL